MKEVFKYTDYKVFLRDLIEENAHLRGYQSRLARAAGCQRSFLSRALHGHVQLTLEHIAGIAAFIPLGELDGEYLLELTQLARAGTPTLKRTIQKRLKALESKKNDLAERFRAPSIVKRDQQARYYSSWHWCALHMIPSIPKYQTSKAIAERLELSELFVEQTLNRLAEMDLVKKQKDGKWSVGKRSLHVSKESAWLDFHHTNWRHRAILNAQSRDEQSLHYTSIQAISVQDAGAIRDLIVKTIEKSREIVMSSPEEELICFNCDLFRV